MTTEFSRRAFSSAAPQIRNSIPLMALELHHHLTVHYIRTITLHST